MRSRSDLAILPKVLWPLITCALVLAPQRRGSFLVLWVRDM